jgi:hypothetical protein
MIKSIGAGKSSDQQHEWQCNRGGKVTVHSFEWIAGFGCDYESFLR